MTANPPGARIVVDGDEAGKAPLNLVLKRDQNHTIVIEKEGYRPTIIMMATRRKTGLGLGLVDLGILAGGTFLGGWAGGAYARHVGGADAEDLDIGVYKLLGGLVGFGVSAVIVANKSMPYTLTPNELDVTLTKAADDVPAEILVLDRRRSSDVRWIRIRVSRP